MLYWFTHGLSPDRAGGRFHFGKVGSSPHALSSDNESWRAVMALKIHNTLTREKEPFEPLVPGRVNMYVCGPTVYDSPHIGHAKASISFDVVVRYLRHLGYDVRYVQNITD